MDLAELIAQLERLPPDTPIVVVYDQGAAEGEIVALKLTPEGAVELIVE